MQVVAQLVDKFGITEHRQYYSLFAVCGKGMEAHALHLGHAHVLAFAIATEVHVCCTHVFI